MSPIPTAEPRIARAILVACIAAFGFMMMYVLIKQLGTGYSPVQTIFFRNLFAVLPVLPLIVGPRGSGFRTRNPKAHAMRLGIGVLGMGCYFYVLPRLPLADATALSFTMPLFLTILSVPLLGEIVGWRRSTAIGVGFLGVIVLAGPGLGSGGDLLTYGIGIAGALFYAFAVITIRQMSSTEPPERIAFYYAAGAAVIMAPVLPFVWVEPSWSDWLMFAGLGLIGGTCQYLINAAYRDAPASIIAPFDYTQLLWAALFGLVIWGEEPTWGTALGAVLIAGSGLYILHRETQLAKAGREPAVAPSRPSPLPPFEDPR